VAKLDKKWPYIANAVFRIVKNHIMVNKVTFVGFRGGDRPTFPPGSTPAPTSSL